MCENLCFPWRFEKSGFHCNLVLFTKLSFYMSNPAFLSEAMLLITFVYHFNCANVAQWSGQLPSKREVVRSNPMGHETIYFFSTFFFGSLTDIQKTFTDTERLPFRCIKKTFTKTQICFPMKYHIKHIDLEIKVC